MPLPRTWPRYCQQQFQLSGSALESRPHPEEETSANGKSIPYILEHGAEHRAIALVAQALDVLYA
eukprot:208172-Pyramimonas_sp.AAC.1